jgi:N-acetylglutamate synthase-like GNAT family acetyltransferase
MEYPMAGIGIRHATIAGSEAIAQLVTDLGYRTSPGQMCTRLEAILHDEDYNTLIASEDERIVGFIGTRLDWIELSSALR